MFNRKSLFVALTVVMMLAMLVPVSFAAPEFLAGLEITAPTTVNPKLITTPYLDDPKTDKVVEGLDVSYVLTITGTQVNDVVVTAWLENDYGVRVIDPKAQAWLQAAKLVTGPNPKTITIQVPMLADGWYDVVVCAVERNEAGGEISDPCARQVHAVRVDNTAPKVTIERPAPGNKVCTWVTGQAYELFGMATDNVAVDSAWFEFKPNQNSDDVIKIANGTAVAGFPGEYTALWDSSQIPDGEGWIRFVAVDTAGNKAYTDWVYVCVENRVKIDLQKGWNLISTPLLLYNSNIDDVMKHVWNPGTGQPWASTPIDMVYTTRDGGATWTFWKNGAPDGVKTIQDGFGYWVHTVAPTQLEFVGTWLSIGPVAPPEYAVRAGWNLIGYTHWGTPTMGPWMETNQSVAEYLGWPMVMSVESMYRYDAAAGKYVPVFALGGTGEQTMKQGAGYWLALSEGGTINP